MHDLKNEPVTSEREHTLLRRYAAIAGSVFGSDLLSEMLYSLARMQRPKTVVELGCGTGLTSLRMALAASENDHGHVWAIDDFSMFAPDKRFEKLARQSVEIGLLPTVPSTPADLIDAMAHRLGVEERLTHIAEMVSPETPEQIDSFPFHREPVDLLLSDFNHGPETVMRLLAAWLGRMAPSSSIFFDSASTWWPTWLALEKVVELLSAGRVPRLFEEWGGDLERLVRRRRFTLIHLTSVDRRRQNGTAWLKIEPVDLVPYPRTRMRSATADWPSW